MCINLQVDTVHPEHEVTHHVEEAELLYCVQQEDPAGLTSFQQTLPGRSHSMFTPVNVIRFLPSIGLLKACCVILHLVYLNRRGRGDVQHLLTYVCDFLI